MKQNIDYGYEIQKVYLEMMLADAATFSRCQAIFDHTLFDRKLQTAADFINNYVKDPTILPRERSFRFCLHEIIQTFECLLYHLQKF